MEFKNSDQMSTYNEQFSIPEMIKTFKSLATRLQRDVYVLLLLLFYVLILEKKDIKLPFDLPKLNYEGGNIVLVCIVFNFICISIMSHLNKLFILYRQIDYEAKQFLGKSNESKINEINHVSAMTSFVLSDNVVSDLILSGSKRHPSLQRYFVLQFLIWPIAIVGTFNMTLDFFFTAKTSISTLLIAHPLCISLLILLAISIIYMGILLMLVRLFFIRRSAFLHKAAMARNVLYGYYDLLRIFNEYFGAVATSKNKIPEQNLIHPLQGMIEEKLVEIKNRDLSNFFDKTWQINFFEKNINEILAEWAKIPEGLQKTLASFMKENLIGNPSVTEYIEKLNSYFKHFAECSEYALAYNYHNSGEKLEQIGSIRAFICFSVK